MFKEILERNGFSYLFAGADYKATEEWLIENNCLRLLSFVNEKRLIEQRCSIGAKTFVDSGAFSATNRKLEINVDEYIEWLNQYHDNFIMYCCWDSIPVGDLDPEECARKTWENYLYMKDRLNEPKKLVYCYHYGEDIKWLKQALDNGVKLIALGGLAKRGKNQRKTFLEEVEKAVKDYDDLIIHAFGMTSFEILERFDFITSADSSTWLYNPKFGEVSCPSYGNVYFGDDMTKKHNYWNLDLDIQMEVDNDLEKFGFTYEDMKERRLRSLYQAHMWNDKMLNFKRK